MERTTNEIENGERTTNTHRNTNGTQDLFNLLFSPIVEGFSAEQQKNN